MDLLVVTGLSGAGKSRAVDALEDIGYYCVDNLPPSLMTKFADLCTASGGHMGRIAIVTDSRGGSMFAGVMAGLDELSHNHSYKVMFLEASTEALIRRYKETRRKHPLIAEHAGSIEEAVESERELLKPIRARADYIIDTSLLSPAQLKERITKLFLGNSSSGLTIHCMSFGFKYGSAGEADLVFDVRCLPNPYYVEELKNHTGLESCVSDYVMQYPQSKEFSKKLLDLIDFLIPLYCNEGKSQLVIAIGCTGGKHRSVTLSEILYEHLKEKGYHVSVDHRDIRKS